jgi:hypothetical protein
VHLHGAIQALDEARVEREIYYLWRNSTTAKDPGLSERLAEVSHALRRAARPLEQRRAIG